MGADVIFHSIRADVVRLEVLDGQFRGIYTEILAVKLPNVCSSIERGLEGDEVAEEHALLGGLVHGEKEVGFLGLGLGLNRCLLLVVLLHDDAAARCERGERRRGDRWGKKME